MEAIAEFLLIADKRFVDWMIFRLLLIFWDVFCYEKKFHRWAPTQWRLVSACTRGWFSPQENQRWRCGWKTPVLPCGSEPQT